MWHYINCAVTNSIFVIWGKLHLEKFTMGFWKNELADTRLKQTHDMAPVDCSAQTYVDQLGFFFPEKKK